MRSEIFKLKSTGGVMPWQMTEYFVGIVDLPNKVGHTPLPGGPRVGAWGGDRSVQESRTGATTYAIPVEGSLIVE